MDYKFIISKVVRLPDLTSSEKLCLIFIIEKLDSNNEAVFINNDLAKEMLLTKQSISKMISSLNNKDYISVNERRVDDMSFYRERYIKISKNLINKLSFF